MSSMLYHTALEQRLEAGASMAVVTDSSGVYVAGMSGMSPTAGVVLVTS